MMNKDLERLLERLKDIRRVFGDDSFAVQQGVFEILKVIVKILENSEKQIEKIEKRIKRLEQKDSYYSVSEEEIRNFKVGGTD
ncbi:MAG TPA: hypothetical protein ENN27_00040 [Candidatus Atribacteria bacterium]|nr:hypothetical protein [Candidatus Atribacteria bacterium]